MPSTPGVALRPWCADDLDELVQAYRDPVLRRWTRAPVTTAAEARRWLEAAQSGLGRRPAVHLRRPRRAGRRRTAGGQRGAQGGHAGAPGPGGRLLDGVVGTRPRRRPARGHRAEPLGVRPVPRGGASRPAAPGGQRRVLPGGAEVRLRVPGGAAGPTALPVRRSPALADAGCRRPDRPPLQPRAGASQSTAARQTQEVRRPGRAAHRGRSSRAAPRVPPRPGRPGRVAAAPACSAAAAAATARRDRG